jgi:hypothetical protein
MLHDDTLLSPNLSRVAPRIPTDRRRHKRVPIALLGRFMRQNRQEFPCKLHDISVGGAAIMAPIDVEMDERVVAYFDHIGGLEGTVVRIFEGGFGMRLSISAHKREKLAAQLTFLLNRHELEGVVERRHERTAPKHASQTLTMPDGVVLPCRVIDISISGASIATSSRPTVGTEIMLGPMRAKVMRHHAQGIGVQFMDVQHDYVLRRHFG